MQDPSIHLPALDPPHASIYVSHTTAESASPLVHSHATDVDVSADSAIPIINNRPVSTYHPIYQTLRHEHGLALKKWKTPVVSVFESDYDS